MLISYDAYRVFYYVAKYQSFTKAAAILTNNQPNMTRIVKNLESALGCVLLTRSNKGVTLTPEGELLYTHISAAMEHIQAGEEAVRKNQSLSEGTITVAVSEIALHGLLLPVLGTFHQQHPGIRIRISNHSTPQAASALKNGLAELALVTTPCELPKPLTMRQLKPFQEVAVGGTAFRDYADRKISYEVLSSLPLIGLNAETKTYEFYKTLFLHYHLEYHPDLEVATTDQVLPVVEHQLGIGFLPDFLAEPAILRGSIFPLQLEEPIPSRQICLLKRTDLSLSHPAKTLEAYLLRAACETKPCCWEG